LSETPRPPVTLTGLRDETRNLAGVLGGLWWPASEPDNPFSVPLLVCPQELTWIKDGRAELRQPMSYLYSLEDARLRLKVPTLTARRTRKYSKLMETWIIFKDAADTGWFLPERFHNQAIEKKIETLRRNIFRKMNLRCR